MAVSGTDALSSAHFRDGRTVRRRYLLDDCTLRGVLSAALRVSALVQEDFAVKFYGDAGVYGVCHTVDRFISRRLFPGACGGIRSVLPEWTHPGLDSGAVPAAV